MKSKLFIFLYTLVYISYGQKLKSHNWSKKELLQYSKLNELANYIYKKKKSDISKDTLFKKYVYFDYVLKDKNIKRKENRLSKFDGVFNYFKKTVDSLGITNLDAKPIRFYKSYKIYKPFDEKQTTLKSVGGKKMYTKDTNVFVYFKKENPENPLGCLLFEAKTGKLISWILINQGGYHYFLTFNLFGERRNIPK